MITKLPKKTIVMQGKKYYRNFYKYYYILKIILIL